MTVDWKKGDRVRIITTQWANDRTGTIHDHPKIGEYIRVRLDDGKVFPAYATELEKP